MTDGWAVAEMPGHVDSVTRGRIMGWAVGTDPNAPAALQILDNGVPIASVLANLHRRDLEAAGIGTGWHGFDVAIPGGLSPLEAHVVEVRREADGIALPGSPVLLAAADRFDAALEAAVAQAVAAIAGEAERARVLAFLAAQTELLLQQQADSEGQRAIRQAHRRGPTQDPAPAQRALIIDERLPLHGRDAGSQAILSHADALGSLGYRVSLVAADEFVVADGAITVHGKPFYHSVEEVLRRQSDCFDLVYLHRASIAARYLALVRQYQPRARVLYSVADLHHLRLERQAAVEQRPDLQSRGRALRLIECTAAWSADAVLTHSAEEADWLRRAVPEANIHRVPWSIDVTGGQSGFTARRGVAFIGSYGHDPNLDAARWLVKVIMPRVWRADPGIACLLVGDGMPESLRALAGGMVQAVGYVPDLQAMLNRVRLTVAPLRFGAGVKGKVLQSLAAGVPCIMTPVAAEGIPLPRELRDLVGADADALARLIRTLHDDPARLAHLADAGMAFVRAEHGKHIVAWALQAAIEGRHESPDRSPARPDA